MKNNILYVVKTNSIRIYIYVYIRIDMTLKTHVACYTVFDTRFFK